MQITPLLVPSLGVFRKELGKRSKGPHKLLPMSRRHSVALLGPLGLSQILRGALRPENILEDPQGERPPVTMQCDDNLGISISKSQYFLAACCRHTKEDSVWHGERRSEWYSRYRRKHCRGTPYSQGTASESWTSYLVNSLLSPSIKHVLHKRKNDLQNRPPRHARELLQVGHSAGEMLKLMK